MTINLLIAKLFRACIVLKIIFIDYKMQFKWITADLLSINIHQLVKGGWGVAIYQLVEIL